MASSRFSFLAASLAVLLLATASCAFAARRVAPPKAAACAKSTLSPYSKSVKLTPDGLFLLHWNLTKTNDGIIAAIEAKKGSGAEAGWMSIGWTKTATKMVPSDVVVGNLAAAAPNNVVAYTMTSKVYPTGMQTTTAAAVALSATSVETTAAGGTIVKFTRKGKGIKAPIANYKAGVKNMIWAFSDTQDFTTGYHMQRGSIAVNFGC
ncbi:unnamed protein product [Closterium sp. Yama58-4]|nr:unnamed protein product [Closterium sp. Yama58-4]